VTVTIRQWLASAQAQLKRSPTPQLDARVLLCHCLGVPHSHLYAHPENRPDTITLREADAMLAARVQGQPVAYLTGKRAFFDLELEVSSATLIPRPETELLVESALAILPAGQARLADLGTGCGAIALAIKRQRPDVQVLASDNSLPALAVAARNQAQIGVRIHLLCAAWLQALRGGLFHAIVSNPPYVAAADKHLGAGDTRFEPSSALVSGPAGLDDLKQIIAHAPSHLLPGGYLLVEHGFNQAPAVRALYRRHGFHSVHTRNDLAGHPRLCCGQWGTGRA